MKFRDEPMIFERSRPGKTGYSLPPLDVEERVAIPGDLLRGEIDGETEVSEVAKSAASVLVS